MKLKGFYNSEFQFSDGIDRHGIGKVQVLKVGSFLHPKAPNGKFDITSGHLNSFKNNFDMNVRNLDKGEIATDFGHDHEGEASGWIKSVFLENNDQELWAEVDWTSTAEQDILDRKWRFTSADVDFEYVDNESGKNHGPTLLGLGLVNRPHIKGMRAIFKEQYTEDANQGAEMEKKILEMLNKMMARMDKIEAAMGSNVQAEEKEMEKENVELKAELAETVKKLGEANETIETHNEEKETIKKEAKFNEFISEGKITPAQKDSFMKMELSLAEELFANANVLNLSENGNGTEPKAGANDTEEADLIHDKATKLMEEDSTLSLSEAYSRVMSEDKELGDKYSTKYSL